jgi:hypothetical protein
VCTGQPLACKKASTVVIAFWVGMGSVEVGSGDEDSVLAKMSNTL